MPIDKRIEFEPLADETLEQFAQAAMRHARWSSILPAGSGIAIRPRNLSRGSAAMSFATCTASSTPTPLFDASPPNVDLQAHVQRRQRFRPLLRKPLRDLQAIHRMHPIELFGHRPRLVRLQRADEMPFERAAQIGEHFDFRERFLHVVFAECALTGGMGRAHVFGGKGLGDGKQRDGTRVASRHVRGEGDALLHRFEVMNQIGHGTNRSGPKVDGSMKSMPRLYGQHVLDQFDPVRTPASTLPLCRCEIQPTFADTITCGFLRVPCRSSF